MSFRCLFSMVFRSSFCPFCLFPSNLEDCFWSVIGTRLTRLIVLFNFAKLSYETWAALLIPPLGKKIRITTLLSIL